MKDSAAISATPPHEAAGPGAHEPMSVLASQPGPPLKLIESGGDVFAFACGPVVSVHAVSLPTRSVSQARTAAPFALEDELAVDPSDVHAAVAPNDDGQTWSVAVVDRDAMAAWSSSLTQLKIQPDALVPESAALAPKQGQVIIADRESYVVAAFHNGPGFACEPDLFPHIFGAVLTGVSVDQIAMYSDRPHTLLPAGEVDLSTVVKNAHLTNSAYEARLVEGALQANLNLLQGPFAARRRWLDIKKSWGGLAAVAGLCVISYLALLALEGLQFSRQTQSAEAEIESVFRQALPDVMRMVNPRIQLQARLNSAQGSSQDAFLSYSTVLIDSVLTVPGSSVEALQFDSSRGVLSASLSLSDYADMERIRTLVTQRGLSLAEGGSRQQSGRILGDVTVKAP